MGDAGGSAVIAELFALQRHFEKRLLDALSWLSETWKISITVKNVANSRCLVDMYIPNFGRVSVGSWCIYTYSA